MVDRVVDYRSYRVLADNFEVGGVNLVTAEGAQDAVGIILTDTATIDFTYNDGANTITADVKASSINLTSHITGVLPVPNGGTGAATFTNNRLLTGNGTSAVVDEANLTFDGTTLDVLTGQIKFPSTQNPSANANTLDDYEEGTFTPVLTFGGGTTGITYDIQAAKYTKIGRLVTFDITIAISNKGSSSGFAKIAGLPFTSAATHPTSIIYGLASSLTLVTNVAAYVIGSSTELQLVDNLGGSAAGFTQIDNNNFQNATNLYFSGSYTA